MNFVEDAFIFYTVSNKIKKVWHPCKNHAQVPEYFSYAVDKNVDL